MSVINKMLRDLDASARPRDETLGHATPMTGTRTVSARPMPGSAPTWAKRTQFLAFVVLLLIALVVVAELVFGVSSWFRGAPARAPVELALPVAAVKPEPPVSAAATPAAIAIAVVTPAASEPSKTAPMPVTKPVAQAQPQQHVTAAHEKAPSLVTAVTASAPPAANAPVTAAVRSPSPSDIVDDAQKLWERGAREAALQLLRDRVDVPNPLGPALGSTATLWLWASELTRMELAQGRAQEALQRLVRLEPWLSGHAVAWATRGNVAQRLARHGESAQAYLAALALRPDEPRWMLGAAVSLAADGQTAAATEWARRVQARGAMNPEIAAYLRQQGVALPQTVP